jgi:pimeloyl-ACP methyl ester carboxylesterase
MASTPAQAPSRKRRPWYHPVSLALRLALYVMIAYAVICVYLFTLQTSLIYPEIANPLPTAVAYEQAQDAGLVPWTQTTPGAAAPQGYVPPDFAKAAPRGTLIVFHGNGGWCVDRVDYVNAFSRRGFRVFLYEYPGYGGRPGRPSEKVIVPDARALIRSLDAAGYGPIYVWGESLGSGVGAAVCADPTLPVHGLVLVTPWDTIANVGLSFYPYVPIRQLMTDKYDSIANLQHFGHPICVVRSEHDEIIPPALSLNLFAHLPDPKKIILQAGVGHNDWPRSPELAWWDDALDFIAPKISTK